MNERIKELAKKVDPELAKETIYCTASDLEKFAELIIRECADFVDQNTLENQGMWGKIMRHFGVEE